MQKIHSNVSLMKNTNKANNIIMVMIIARLCFIYSQIESLNQCTYDYIITIKKKFMQTVVILSTDTVDVRSIS